MSLAQWLTDLADGAVLLPLAGMVTAALALQGRWRLAAVWAVSVGGTLGLMLVLKLAIAACGAPLGAIGLRSPSGHTASAAVVYGGLIAMLAGLRGWDAALPGLAVAAGIAATRIVLQVHSLADVMVGAGVGVGGSVVLAQLAARCEAPGSAGTVRRRRLGTLGLLLGGLVLAVALHGAHLDVEDRIRALGVRLGAGMCEPG